MFRRRPDCQLDLSMALIFRRLLAESAFNEISKLKLDPRLGTLQVRKAIPSEILHLGKDALELLDMVCEVFDPRRFGP